MIWLTITITIALIAALFFINRRRSENNRELEARESHVAKLRQRAGQVEDLIRSWCRIGGNCDVANELYQLTLEIFDRIIAMDPGYAFAASEQQRLLAVIDKLSDAPQTGKHTVLVSTGELARLQSELKDIKRILRSRATNEALSQGLYQQYCEEIKWLGSQTALDTCLALAHTAFADNQPERAEHLLQQALSTIEAADIADPRIRQYYQTVSGLMQQLPPQAAASK